MIINNITKNIDLLSICVTNWLKLTFLYIEIDNQSLSSLNFHSTSNKHI